MAKLNHICLLIGVVLLTLSLTVFAHAGSFQFNCSDSFQGKGCEVMSYCQPNGIPGLTVWHNSCGALGSDYSGNAGYDPCNLTFSSPTSGEHFCTLTIKTTSYDDVGANNSSDPALGDQIVNLYINGSFFGKTNDPMPGYPNQDQYCGLITQTVSGEIDLSPNNTLTIDGGDEHAVVSVSANCQLRGRDCSQDLAPVINVIPNKIIHYNSLFGVDLWDYVRDYDDSLADLNVDMNVIGNSVSCTLTQKRYLTCTAGTTLGDTNILLTATDPCGKTSNTSFAATVFNDPPAIHIPDYERSCASDMNRLVDLRNYSYDENSASLVYTITGQSNPSLLNCRITDGRYVSCDTNICAQSYSDITVRATDIFGSYAQDTFRITLKNFSPTWNQLPSPCFNSAQAKFLDLKDYAYDLEDKNNLGFTLTQSDNLAINCFVDPDGNHLLSCNNLSNRNATNVLTLNATDSLGATATTTMNVTANCKGEDHNDIIIDSNLKSICLEKCTSYSAEINVENNTNDRRCFDFYKDTFPEDLQTSLTNSKFCLNGGEKTSFALSANTCGANGNYKVKVIDSLSDANIGFDYQIGGCQSFDGFKIEEFDGKICKGTEQDLTVTVTNTSSAAKNISLISENSFMLPFFDRAKVFLNAGASKRVQLHVNAKSASLGLQRIYLGGDADNFHIEKKLDVEVVDCSVFKPRTFTLTVPQVCFNVSRGQVFESGFDVDCVAQDNCCDCSFNKRQLGFQLFDISGGLGFATTELTCGQGKRINYFVNVPTNASAGRDFFSIYAVDKETGFSEEKKVCLNVAGESQAGVTLRTQTQDILWCGSAIFELGINNTGDFDENFNLSANNLPAGVTANFSDGFINVPKGSSKTVYVSVATSPSSAVADNESIRVDLNGRINLTATLYFNVKEKAIVDDLEILSASSFILIKGNNPSQYYAVIRNNTARTLRNITVGFENTPSGVTFESASLAELPSESTATLTGKISAADVNGYSEVNMIIRSGSLVNTKKFGLSIEKQLSQNQNDTNGNGNSGLAQDLNNGTFSAFFSLFTLNSELVVALFLILLFLLVVVVVVVLTKPRKEESWV